ncbi:MAG: haloacid dehalogenase-like hydrolase [Reichenbachiella sp.]
MKSNLILFSAILLLVIGCDKVAPTNTVEEEVKYLTSWNEGASKASLISFVEGAIDSSGQGFIPESDRVAVFDNDGTLWSEQPMYFQLFFAIDQIKNMAADHPEWKDTAPFKSVLNNDMEGLMAQGEHALLQIIAASHGGMTVKEFESQVKSWMQDARHPKFDRPFTDLIYQPMLEVLIYLRANGFKTYIVSGGGVGFMRPVTEQLYGIPADQVVGSMMKTEFVLTEEGPQINKLPELYFVDDKAGKPIGIYNFIGKQPVAAFGNSDGDLQMLQWTDGNDLPSFQMYVHHDDAVREWAYDSLSHIGRLNNGFTEASANDWTITSIKDDWNVVYPFELAQ